MSVRSHVLTHIHGKMKSPSLETLYAVIIITGYVSGIPASHMLFFLPFQIQEARREEWGDVHIEEGACAYVRMSTVSFVVNACGLWRKKK